MTTRMKFAIIGLGQCGGNIANTFAKYGYPSMAINTSMLDLKDLANIPDNRKFHIPLNDSDGAGKDPRIGEKALQGHMPNITAGMQQFITGADAILLTAGLGGGTGSNIALLGSMLKRFNLPIVALVTIPTNNESALAKINALRAVNRIVGENFDSCVIIDNSKILQQFPDSNLAAFYPQANDYVVRTFASFNSLSAEFSSRCLISFDNEDFRKVLLSKGILIFGETEVPASQLTTLDDILPKLKNIWETSGLMAEGFNFSTAASGAVSIFAPAALLQKTSSRFLNMLGEEFKSLTNGATCYFGLYELPSSANTIKICTMLGRLTIPVRLQEMLAEASTEGKNLTQKIQQVLPTLDISALESMELFSSGPEPRVQHQITSETQVLNRDTGASYGSNNVPAYAADRSAGDGSSDTSENQDGQDNSESRSYSLEEYVRLKKLKSPAG